MTKVRKSPASRRRRAKVLKATRGQFGAKKNVYRRAVESYHRGLAFAYRDRRAKKREFRRLWIVRINAEARNNGLSYSRFMDGLNKADIEIDRKVLADLAVHDKAAFSALAEKAKASLA